MGTLGGRRDAPASVLVHGGYARRRQGDRSQLGEEMVQGGSAAPIVLRQTVHPRLHVERRRIAVEMEEKLTTTCPCE